MLTVVGKVVLELREDAGVAALVGVDENDRERVRGYEPAPGDSQGAGSFRAFVVVSQLSGPPHPRVPIQRVRLAVRCYADTPANAMTLYAACSGAMHHIGPRIHANGLGIYVSHDDTGGTQGEDPDTHQPYTDFVIELLATTQAVAA